MSEDGRLTILCIEDNPVNWRLVQRLLTQAGYDMHWAEEGLKGFDMALALKPDLVLLDINLPGLSGFEIASKFRAHPELKSMKIVALTAKTLKADRETALVAGCDGFIPKPIDPFTFVKQVADYLGGQKDLIEQGREGAVLRNFNAQVLEHLEVQLKEAQESNRKLLDAQSALEGRNRSLGRLLTLSQSILSEHDPATLMTRILREVVAELKPSLLTAFRLHRSGGYWEGVRFAGAEFEPAPVIPFDALITQRLFGQMSQGSTASGDRLRVSRVFDEGTAQGLWDLGQEPALIFLPDRQNDTKLWGFWTLGRSRECPWKPEEMEQLALLSSMALTNVENAELIMSLNDSTQALASSYERMEQAYQDLQRAKEDLRLKDRQVLLEDLFLKIAHRLQTPLSALRSSVYRMDELLTPTSELHAVLDEEAPKTLVGMQEAVLKIDGLLKALLRRSQKSASEVPEWIDLHELILQEMELLHAEWGISPELEIDIKLEAGESLIFGVYGDFAKILHNLVQHALSSPTPPSWMQLHSWKVGEQFHLALRDNGGVMPPSELEQAFEPFSSLHQAAVMGVRSAGAGLASMVQTLASYHGEADITNEDEGTLLHLHFPLR